MAETVTLGERTFELRRPKLGQLRPIVDALDAMAGKDGGAIIEPAAELVAAGLRVADPEITAAQLLDIEAPIKHLNDAVAAVLRISGLREVETEPGGAGPGEDAPAAS